MKVYIHMYVIVEVSWQPPPVQLPDTYTAHFISNRCNDGFNSAKITHIATCYGKYVDAFKYPYIIIKNKYLIETRERARSNGKRLRVQQSAPFNLLLPLLLTKRRYARFWFIILTFTFRHNEVCVRKKFKTNFITITFCCDALLADTVF